MSTQDRSDATVDAHQENYGRHRGDGRPGLFRKPDVLHRTPAYVDHGGSALMTETRTAVLQPTGRLNMVAAPAFKNLVEETVASGQTRIVVDLGQVTFIDSSGLGALISGL